MPVLYNYVNELVNLNWNSVMIYTCEDSCTATNGYEFVEEFAYVEMIDEEERKMDLQNSEAIIDATKTTKSKGPKPAKTNKNKPKDGEEKSGLDSETEAQIKKQLEDLQLDLE